MQVKVPANGKTIIHLTRAIRMFEKRIKEMENCASCDRGMLVSLKEGLVFYNDLLTQVQGETNGSR